MRRDAKQTSGMTLVEVVCGLALLGTLLASMLMAKARYTKQATVAERRLKAVRAADELLGEWWRDTSRFPRADAGSVAGDDEFSWRTRRVADAKLAELGVEVVRLEVIDDRRDEVLAAVEVPLGGLTVAAPQAEAK